MLSIGGEGVKQHHITKHSSEPDQTCCTAENASDLAANARQRQHLASSFACRPEHMQDLVNTA